MREVADEDEATEFSHVVLVPELVGRDVDEGSDVVKVHELGVDPLLDLDRLKLCSQFFCKVRCVLKLQLLVTVVVVVVLVYNPELRDDFSAWRRLNLHDILHVQDVIDRIRESRSLLFPKLRPLHHQMINRLRHNLRDVQVQRKQLVLGIDRLVDARAEIDVADEIVDSVEADRRVEAAQRQAGRQVVFSAEVLGDLVLDGWGDTGFCQEEVN